MSVGAFVAVIRRRWTWVTAAVLFAVVVAGIGSAAATRSYSATASVFFSLQFGNSANELAQGSNYTQQAVTSYALLARTPTVLQPVIDAQGSDTSVRALAGQVSTSVVPDTVVVDVTVSDPSPARAVELADAVAEQLGTTVEELAPATQDGKPTVEATTVAPAVEPRSPDSPRTALNLAAALVAGLFVGVLAALARDATDTRVRSPEDVSTVTPLPVLASLDAGPAVDGRRSLVVSAAPYSIEAEGYRALRTAVQFVVEPGRTLSLQITSARPGEGKSTVAANLAIALAEAGLTVALVDADLRRPSVADTFGLEHGAGLTSVLIGQADVEDVLQPWGPSGLRLLTTGPLPPNPSELLAAPAMTDLVATLERTHDVVIFDTAPLLAVTDAVVLSRAVSGTLLVGDSTKLRRKELRAGLSLLERAGARVVGMVLSHVRQRADVYGYASSMEADQETAALALTAVRRGGAGVNGAGRTARPGADVR
ncbi:polysaccharide biosynthesis tyrosine autokinase [Blastococcus mobilis]|uniref:Capsular exopolysaccharide family n=1 Tax=Blastococcus mobilis TaxID=1938746 RepID=A0A238W4N7_9ACTN|nr:polysaccharide biosynthesis tyrosine autokinase [Blastococcus mobilis]SNR41458.1 capsular exopolysaccharide family [Blastococcus mobilis]